VTAPALELADIFRIHSPAYLAQFGNSLNVQQKERSGIFRSAELPPLAVTCINAKSAATAPSHIAPAGIDIAPNVGAPRGRHGSISTPPIFCRLNTSMWYSRCPSHLLH
jgi:hypothetical protein